MKKEYKINDTFQFQEKTLIVVDNPDKGKRNPCTNCYFNTANCACWDDSVIEIIGECESTKRVDNKKIIFVES